MTAARIARIRMNYTLPDVSWRIHVVLLFVSAIAITTVRELLLRSTAESRVSKRIWHRLRSIRVVVLDLTKEGFRWERSSTSDKYDRLSRYARNRSYVIYSSIKTPKGRKNLASRVYRCYRRDVRSMISLTIEQRGGNVARCALSEIN